MLRWNGKTLMQYGGMQLRGVDLCVALSCVVSRVQCTTSKGSPAWLIQDYTGRQLVPFQWLSTLLSVMPLECITWNQLSSLLLHHSAHLMVHGICVTSLVWDLTWHVVQLRFGRDFRVFGGDVMWWISVRPAGRHMQSKLSRSLRETLACGSYFSLTAHTQGLARAYEMLSL